MMYNDVDSDLPPFNDTIDGEEIFLFSNAKTSSSNGTSSFLHEDDDEHLRHQHHHNVVASSSSHHHHHHHHMPVDVDELLLNSNFLEQPNCDQSEDPLFWNCKGISDDHLSEFLPQSQLNLSNNSNNGTVVSAATTTAATSTSVANNAIVTPIAINDSNNNNNNPSTNISINQQQTQILSLDNQHPQRIIPIHHLQSQPTQISQQQIHIQQHIRLQHNQIQQQQPQQVAVLQQQQSTQLQLQSSHQTGFQQQHQIIQQQQHEQYQTKWITLIPTGGDQYQPFSTAQQPQFFDKIPQQQQQPGLIQTEIVLSPASTLQQASLSSSIDTNHESHTLIQVPAVRITQQQPPQQQRQPQIQIQIQPPQQSVSPFQQQLISEHKSKISPGSTIASNSAGNTTTNCGDNNNNINNALILKKDPAAKPQKSKEKQTRLDCPYCKRSFSKNFDLQQHMRCHTGEKPFQCIVCGRGFAQKSNVKKHMQAHKVWPEGPNNPSLPSNHGNTRSRNNSASSSIGTPRDDECMQENESLQINDNAVNNNGITLGLSNDKKNDGNDIFAENRYSCSYCQFNGRTYFELKSHLTIHKREKVFKCIVSSCGKTFSGSDLQGFLDHVTGHKDLIYHCHLCSGQFYSLDEFGEHQKHHSTAQMKRTSNQQTSQSQSQHPQAHVAVLNPQNNTSLRQQNQQVVSTQLQPQQNQRQYNQQQQTQTQQLNNTQKSNQLYNSQQQSKANQKFFRCTKCMNRYTTQTALDHHLSISTHNFPCTECNKVFMCERYLRRHLNTHTAVQYVCTFCDKQFRTAAYLKMHSVVHTGEKPFRCNLCEAAFNRRDKLNRHKLTHEPVKKFKCPFKPNIGCTKEFNRPDKLKAHVLTHSGIRPHPCDLCSRTFSRLSRLREHKKLHHASQKDLSQQNQMVFESGEPNPGGGKII